MLLTELVELILTTELGLACELGLVIELRLGVELLRHLLLLVHVELFVLYWLVLGHESIRILLLGLLLHCTKVCSLWHSTEGVLRHYEVSLLRLGLSSEV